MPEQTKHTAPLPFLQLDREGGTPLYLQLIQQLRRMIQTGAIKPGQKLPSTRWMKEHHGIEIHGYLSQLGPVKIETVDHSITNSNPLPYIQGIIIGR